MTVGAPLVFPGVEVDCVGGVLDCWRDEEGGVGGRHINHSR